jgi:hypothetical protein
MVFGARTPCLLLPDHCFYDNMMSWQMVVRIMTKSYGLYSAILCVVVILALWLSVEKFPPRKCILLTENLYNQGFGSL